MLKVDDKPTQSHISTPSISNPPPYSEPSSISVPSADSFKSQLLTLLGIDFNLTGSGEVSLPVAYQKYMAFLTAFQTLQNMVSNNTWMIKQPTKLSFLFQNHFFILTINIIFQRFLAILRWWHGWSKSQIAQVMLMSGGYIRRVTLLLICSSGWKMMVHWTLMIAMWR